MTAMLAKVATLLFFILGTGRGSGPGTITFTALEDNPNIPEQEFALHFKPREQNVTPIVMWHGMGDCCCNPLSMGSVVSFFKENIPGVYILSLEIGSNVFEDTENGFFMNVNKQIDYACKVLQADDKLKDGYNAVGFSQGGLFLRAIAERCPNPPIKNLISIGGPQQGVFGFPKCPGGNTTICEFVSKMLNIGAYNSFIQNHLVQAEYWHDPLNEDEYKQKSIFLADINNENTKKQEYKNNLSKLQNFAMVMFSEDTMVVPKESEWFGFFNINQDKTVYMAQDSALYKEDWIGIKTLDEAGKLHFLEADGDHLQIDMTWFKINIVDPFLR